MKAGIYVRVSTTQQVDRDSLRTQEERLRQYCKAQGFEVYKGKPYKDEGISAKDIKRPGFEELMNDIKAGKIQVIAITRLDRITRSLKDLISLMEFLQQHNVKLISLTESIDTTGPMGRFMLNLLGSIAQLEREIDSERVSADMHHRASAGKWTGGVVPLGYTTKGKLVREFTEKGMEEGDALKEAGKIAPEKGRLYVVKNEAKLVNKIYELYLRVRSLRRVTHELNREEIKTPEGETWAASSIKRIISSPVYIGKISYGKRKTDLATGKLRGVKHELWKVVKGEHEAIIPDEIYERVQNLLKQRYLKPSKAKKVYMLTGLLKCGLCKGGMFGYTYVKNKDKRPNSYFYYRCQNSVQKGDAVCKGMLVSGDAIEKAVTQSLLSLSKNEKFLEDKELMLKALRHEGSVEKPDFEETRKRLLQEEMKLTEIRDTLLEKLENKVIDDAVFMERFNENKKSLESVRDRIAEIAGNEDKANLHEAILKTSFDELCNLPEIWRHFTDEEKQEKLRSIISHVVVNRDKNANKMKLKIGLFLDSANSKNSRFQSVVFPCRKDRDSLHSRG